MKGTGVFASKEDLGKLIRLAQSGWMPNEVMITFSVGDGIRKDQATVDAKRVCHSLALDYGLPEIGIRGNEVNMAIVVRSSWQVKQWAKIERHVSYSVTCSICGWADVTGSKKEAEQLFRIHVADEHNSPNNR